MKSKEKYITAAVIVLFTIGFGALVVSSAELKDTGDSRNNTKPTVTTGAPKDSLGTIRETTPTPTTIANSPTPTLDPIVGAKTIFNDLQIGEIGEKDNVYIGLQYVKAMTYLPTRLGKENVQEGNEVIIAFFEVYNNKGKEILFLDDDVTCYADGVQVSEVETYIVSEIDGIRETSMLSLESTFQLLTPINYEVPKGWKELKFFYKSDCVWTVSADEVGSEEFENEPLIHVEKQIPLTSEDEIIYSGDYTIQFKGAEFYQKKSTFSDGNYAVFKFTISNTGDSVFTNDATGVKMHLFSENYYVDYPSAGLNDRIDGYTNLLSVKTIEAGMSANVYIAVECSRKPGKYYFVYDDGFLVNHYCGYVYTELK